MYDFGKLLENMPANLSELARLADVSERSIMRMRDGDAVLRGTANKILRGLSQIYGSSAFVVLSNKEKVAKTGPVRQRTPTQCYEG
jgi:hypothetical protein